MRNASSSGRYAPTVMIASSFSNCGQLILRPLITPSCTRAFNGTSTAEPRISPSPMAVAEIEKASFYVDGEIDGVADAGLGRVHGAAKFGRDQRTAGLAISRGNADASEERMHGSLHREGGVERLEGCRVCRVIDVVEPYPLFQRWLKHRRVMRTVDRTETRGKGADAHVAV